MHSLPPRHRLLAQLALTATLLMGACAVNPTLGEPTPPAARERAARGVMAIADEYVAESFVQNPILATLAGVPGAQHGEMIDNSLAGVLTWQQKQDRWLTELRKTNPEEIATPQRVIYGVLRERLEAARDLRVCRDELWPVSHANGWQVNLPGVASRQPVGTPELRRLALSRFEKVVKYIDTEISNLRQGLRTGYSAPKLTVELTIKQLDGLLSAELERNPVFDPARRDPTPEFVDRWRALVLGQINPAAERYRNFLRDEYLPAAREAVAVSGNPNGAACYRAKVRWYTTLDVDPADLFTQQMTKLEEAQALMGKIAERTYGTSDVRKALGDLYNERDSSFQTREEAIAAAEALVKRSESFLPKLFANVPTDDIVVQPMPTFLERTTPGHRYVAAPEDGSRPPVFELNVLRSMEPGGKLQMEVVAFHEGAPGHHLQVSLARGLVAHPLVRYFGTSAFGEGWATYAQRLAYEQGMYSSDAAGIVALSGISIAHAMNVAEIGMHVKGWSRQQAIDFRSRYSARSADQVVSTIDRRAAYLGQGLAYEIGESEILSLREQARRTLGAKFDLREFHSRVLEDGFITLPMLREKIRRWIDDSR